MGYKKRKLADQRGTAAEKEAASRRATEAQILDHAERLIALWNERQAKRILVPADVAAGPRVHWRLIECQSIQRGDLFPSQLIGGTPAHAANI
jgi:hypothetical protein